MANRRMIASDFFEDDFVGCILDHFERLLWIGLFTSVADDQGRMIDNAALMRAKIFLYDDITDSQVEKALDKFHCSKKIIRYEKEGKKLIQIIKWWVYQTPSWASPSKYPAPNGWIDREKYHAPGNKVVTKRWDEQGGLHSGLHSQQDSGIEDVDVNGDGKGNVNGDGDDEDNASDTPNFYYKFSQILQIPLMGGKDLQYLEDIVQEHGDAKILEIATWLKARDPDINSMWKALRSIDTAARNWKKQQQQSNDTVFEEWLNGNKRNGDQTDTKIEQAPSAVQAHAGNAG